MRLPHYWRVAGPGSAPSNILVFDTEAWHGHGENRQEDELQTLRIGCAIAYRLSGSNRTRKKRTTFFNPGRFWGFVHDRLDVHRPLWVFGHNLAYDLGIVGGWGLLGSEDFEPHRVAVSGGIFFMTGLLHGRPVTFCDTGNYYRCSLETIGKSLGFPKLDMPDQRAGDDVWETYCMRDVEVTAAAVDSLIAFVRDEQLGPWQPTIAGLAFSGFRSRFMTHNVLVHDHARALRLEREGYYGGIVDTGHIGAVPSTPVYELDVCSMYPSVCLQDMPTVHQGWTDRLSVGDVSGLLDSYSVLAKVAVETVERTFPVRLKSGVYHPTGRYVTVLPDPELREAMALGLVREVYEASWYTAEPVFADYMRYFTERKIEYGQGVNKAWETLCKYYANTLYGKTGQLSHGWCEWDHRAMARLEEQHGLPEGTLSRYGARPPTLYELEGHAHLPGLPSPVKVRDLFGVVEVQVGESESRDSCPAIAATVTSYARCLLRGYQRIAGAGHWFYSDTDSIWTDADGKRRLEERGCVSPGILGKLDCKAEHARMVVYGPKDYETDRVRRIKGVRAKAKPDGKGGWVQLHFPSTLVQMRDSTGGGVLVRRVTKRLHRQVTKCRVLPDGTTRPLRFPEEMPSK